MRHVLLSTFLLFSFLPGQEATASKIYWNSLSTDVNVGVPLADDESLKGGRIQIRVSFNAGKSFSDLGDPFFIEKRDIDDLKEISIQNNVFESMPGFKEGGEAHFIAEIWDKAGNSILGEVSDSVLTIDETIPTIVSLMVTSSNSLDPSLAMPADSLTFDLIASEPIDPPLFEINGDDFAVVGFEKSWKTIYPAEEADDGPITFEIRFNDIAQNLGEPVTTTSDKKIITKDGTIPELDNIKLFTSNQYDTSLAVKGDSVFLQFTASEPVRDLNVTLGHNEAIRKSEDSLTFTFFHVFTESDTEGVIPIAIEFNDMAGNVGELVDETSDDSEITYDMTPPAAFKVETVGSFQGGTKHNIIPDEVKLQLTIRTYKEKVRNLIHKRIKEICNGVASSMGLDKSQWPEVTIPEKYTPANFNDSKLVDLMMNSSKEIIGVNNVIVSDPQMVGEDFSRFGNTKEKIPTVLYWLGTVPDDRMKKYEAGNYALPGLHSPFYYPEIERSIITGIKVNIQAMIKIFNN